jgi:hypothetical protein
MIAPVAIALVLIASHPPRPVGVPVQVEADPKAVYYAKCHIRTFHAPNSDVNFGTQGFVNTYVIDSHGPFFDRIPSPNAQCVFGKLKGPGPVTLHLFKNGDHAVTVTTLNTWMRLNVW